MIHDQVHGAAAGKVHLAPAGFALVGGAVATAICLVLGLPPSGWIAAVAYLTVSGALFGVGLQRRGAARFGGANAVTAARSTAVGIILGLVVASFLAPIPVPLLIALIVPALALDALDGWVARRTGTASELGARFDMEVDAFLLLVLSIYVAPGLGAWVLAIGLMRYAYVAAGWVVPRLRGPLPPRYWRKVVAAVQGIALTIAASGLAPHPVSTVVVLAALALLVESFGRDVAWLLRRPPPDPSHR